MTYSSHFTIPQKQGASTKNKSKSTGKYVRVVHVVTSLDDPKCHDASYLNGVYYRSPKVATNEDSTEGLSFAYQGNVNSRTIPMVGEMVELTSYSGAAGPAKGGSAKYWISTLPIWNHPHHNAAPDTKQPEWRNNLLGGIQEQSNVNPLQANPGDTLIEGRLSQTIRLGGFKGSTGTLVDDSNNGKPYVIISNGQIKTEDGNTPVLEDINKDNNSIYFLSDHKIPLTTANTKRDSYNEIPVSSDQYKGNQIVVNASRLYLNAKDESAFISAKQSIGLNANTLNFDATDYLCVDAKKIYLGKKARTATTSVQQPVVLGKQMENWLSALLDALDLVATSMTNASAVGAGSVTQLNTSGPVLKSAIQSLKSQFTVFQSKKVFVE